MFNEQGVQDWAPGNELLEKQPAHFDSDTHLASKQKEF